MHFRPCIDLHDGQVKQIVGSTLDDNSAASLKTNFVATQTPDYFARRYQADGLSGVHVIKLGDGNDDAARQALAACPGYLQLGGGINAENASGWLAAGAGKLIVTSFLFVDGDFSQERLEAICKVVPREKLVLDLSCKMLPDGSGYAVACDRWRHITSLRITPELFQWLGGYCSEFLVHAVAEEGRRGGIDGELVRLLGMWCGGRPVTYAGGIRDIDDILELERLGQGRVDFTVGSALDLFGGSLKYSELLKWR